MSTLLPQKKGQRLQFEQHLRHMYPLCQAQVKAGIYTAHRSAAFLTKIMNVQKEAAKNARAAIAHETTKDPAIRQDQNDTFVHLYKQLAASIKETIVRRQEMFATGLENKVVVPLATFAKQAQGKMEKIMQQESTAANTVVKAFATAAEQRRQCFKLWEELRALVQPPAAGKKPIADAPRKQHALKTKVKKQFRTFESVYANSMKTLEQYRGSALPKILHELQKLETERLTVMHQSLKAFADVLIEFDQPRDIVKQLHKEVGDVEPRDDLQKLMQKWVELYGFGWKFITPCADLPVPITDLDDDRKWRAAILDYDQVVDDEEEEEEGYENVGAGLGGTKSKAKGLLAKLRGKVSKKKRRFEEDGFDLDLTYITPQIIAMGYPGSGMQSLVRNPMPQVQKFFEKRHKKHHKVYNLCFSPSLVYPASKFHKAAAYPFPDHNSPSLQIAQAFCEDAAEFLKKSEENVIAVHCKAGKGRTGCVLACLLLHMGICQTAEEALEYFAQARTKNSKAVMVPSQKRYVAYYQRLLDVKAGKAGVKPVPASHPMILRSVIVHGAGSGLDDLAFSLRKHPHPGPKCDKKVRIIYSSRKHLQSHHREAENYISFTGVSVDGIGGLLDDDICVHFENKGKHVFHTWFNTRMLEVEDAELGLVRVCVPKPEICKARKDKTHKKFPEELAIELILQSAEELYRRSTVASSIFHGEDVKAAIDAAPQQPEIGVNESDDFVIVGGKKMSVGDEYEDHGGDDDHDDDDENSDDDNENDGDDEGEEKKKAS